VIALVLLIVIAISVLIGAVVSSWRAAVRSGNEAATVQNLKAIAAVEAQYFNAHNRTFGTLDQLVREGMDARFSGERPVIDDYVFTLKVIPQTAGQSASYILQADPQRAGAKRHFYFDSTGGTIHVNADRPATATDSPLGE
jgi:Tfp pilus assembly protein PilE